jgi:spermidine/putrescine transport system permease protein
MTRLRPGTIALYVVSALGFLYLLIPVITIAVFSFNNPTGRRNVEWEGFTLDYWKEPFAREDFTEAFQRSILIAIIAGLIATVVGSLIALALVRYRFKGGSLINLLLVLPLTTPEIIAGASLFTLFFNWGVGRGFWTIVVAHTMFCLSFVALTVKARLRGFDWSLEDAAMDLGSPPLRTFVKVTMPLIIPGVVAAFMLSLALSIDDYIITSFVAGETKTFPREVWDSALREIPPQVHILATIIMIVSISFLIGSTIYSNRRAKAQAA